MRQPGYQGPADTHLGHGGDQQRRQGSRGGGDLAFHSRLDDAAMLHDDHVVGRRVDGGEIRRDEEGAKVELLLQPVDPFPARPQAG